MNYITFCLSDAGGKLEANWLGPYTVKTIGPNHQAVLEKVEAQSEHWPVQAIFRTHVS